MKYHLIWYIPSALMVFSVTSGINAIYVWGYMEVFFRRFHWLVLFSPSTMVFLNDAWFSVAAPTLGLIMLPKIFCSTPNKKIRKSILYLVSIIGISILSEVLLWGSFPLPVDDQNNIHIRMIPFIPWPSEGRSNYFFFNG